MVRLVGMRGIAAIALVACGAGPAGPAAAPPRPAAPGIDLATPVALGMVDGPSTATLTVIEAFDLQCPHCARVQGPLDELVREHRGRIRVVYKSWVLPQHTRAAHVAACAAGKQGKFRAFVDALRVEQSRHEPTPEEVMQLLEHGTQPAWTTDAALPAVARAVGLDLAAFEADRQGAWCRAFVDRDQREMDRFAIASLPFFVIGDQRLATWSKDELRAVIDARLAAPR